MNTSQALRTCVAWLSGLSELVTSSSDRNHAGRRKNFSQSAIVDGKPVSAERPMAHRDGLSLG
ncbi:MAG: hypothetical protein MJE77_41295 [Proteobacteria bacterium]|nr:hypothetical protein [Pseudomonadota bacterium]